MSQYLLLNEIMKEAEKNRLNPRAEFIIAVKLGVMNKTSSPGEDAGDEISAGGAALLVLPIVPRHRPKSGFRLYRPSVGTQQHRA